MWQPPARARLLAGGPASAATMEVCITISEIAGLDSETPHRSDRGTLGDVSQSPQSSFKRCCKLLILNGEMLERSIRHAWKLTPATRADAYQIPPTHFPSTTSRNIDMRRHVPVNDGV